MQKKYNKTWSLRMEALECRQMLSVMGAGTDNTATDYAQEMVAPCTFNIEDPTVVALSAIENSETVVANWIDSADTTWYDVTNVQTEYTLTTEEQLAGLAQLVNKGNSFNGITIKLDANINLEGKEWTPIGYAKSIGWNTCEGNLFEGNFDGCGYKISNLTINRPEDDFVGFFGAVKLVVTDANLDALSIGNFTLENANVVGRNGVGAVIGGGSLQMFWGDTHGTLEVCGISATNINVSGIEGVGGLLGQFQHGNRNYITNCHVSDSVITGLREGDTLRGGSGVGGLAGFYMYSFITDSSVMDTTITGGRYIGGLAGQAGYESLDMKHEGNLVDNVTITAMGEEGKTNYSAGALVGYNVGYNGDGSEKTGEAINVFKNVTIQITAPNGENPRDIPVQIVGQYEGQDYNEPVAQIVKNNDTFTSFSNLQDAVDFYDAANKTIALLADVTLTEALTIPANVALNSNSYNFTGTILSSENSITFNNVTYETSKLIIVNSEVSTQQLATPTMTFSFRNGEVSIPKDSGIGLEYGVDYVYQVQVAEGNAINLSEAALTNYSTFVSELGLSAYEGQTVSVTLTAVSLNSYTCTTSETTTMAWNLGVMQETETAEQLATPTVNFSFRNGEATFGMIEGLTYGEDYVYTIQVENGTAVEFAADELNYSSLVTKLGLMGYEGQTISVSLTTVSQTEAYANSDSSVMFWNLSVIKNPSVMVVTEKLDTPSIASISFRKGSVTFNKLADLEYGNDYVYSVQINGGTAIELSETALTNYTTFVSELGLTAYKGSTVSVAITAVCKNGEFLNSDTLETSWNLRVMK